MMVNIGTRVPMVYIAFFSSRNAALIEQKVLQYTTLSIKLHHFTLSALKTQGFYIIRCPSLSPKTLRGSETTVKPELFIKKTVNITSQACVDIANEYLQSYNRGAGVKSYVLCSPQQCKCADIQCF